LHLGSKLTARDLSRNLGRLASSTQP